MWRKLDPHLLERGGVLLHGERGQPPDPDRHLPPFGLEDQTRPAGMSIERTGDIVDLSLHRTRATVCGMVHGGVSGRRGRACNPGDGSRRGPQHTTGVQRSTIPASRTTAASCSGSTKRARTTYAFALEITSTTIDSRTMPSTPASRVASL